MTCGAPIPIATIYAHIDNGVVINILSAEKKYFEKNPDRFPGQWVDCRIDETTFVAVDIGWTYDGEKFIPPEPQEVEDEID